MHCRLDQLAALGQTCKGKKSLTKAMARARLGHQGPRLKELSALAAALAAAAS